MLATCTTDLKENYYALAVSIFTKATPERAFELLDTGLPVQGVGVHRKDITQADVDDMIKLRKAGYSYQAIGNMYGMTHCAIYRRIIRKKNLKK